MEGFWDLYILPWIINIAMAIAIFVVGRWIAKQIVNLTARVMRRAKVDDMLVNFVTSIVT